MEEPPKEEPIKDIDYNDGLTDDFGIDPFMDGTGQSPIDKHKDLLKSLTDFDPIVQRKIRNWLGLEWDEEVKDYHQKYPAVINEKGARWAIGLLGTYQSKTNFITNITQIEFKNMQSEILDSVWMVFPTNDTFGVKNNQDWHRLCTELQHSAFLVLAGAGDGKYTKFLGESVTRTESVNLSPPTEQRRQEQGGFLSGIRNKLLGRS
jgi:hypothetical protein